MQTKEQQGVTNFTAVVPGLLLLRLILVCSYAGVVCRFTGSNRQNSAWNLCRFHSATIKNQHALLFSLHHQSSN